MSRGGKEGHGDRERRPATRHPRPADPAHAGDRAAARLGHRAAHRADLARGPVGDPGLALPGPLPARGAGRHRRRVGDLGETPPRQVLPPDAGRQAPARARDGELGALRGSRRPRAADGVKPVSVEEPTMSAIHRALAAVRGLFQRRRLEAELDEELRFHLAMETAAQLRQGASPEEAARRAALKLGGLEPTKEAARSARGYRGLEALGQDVRFALRLLRRNPGYAGAVVAALALGIGANTAIFSVVRGVLLHELPYREPDRLGVLHQRPPPHPHQEQGFSVPDIEDLRRRQPTFAGLAEYHSMWFNLLGRGEPERVQTGVVSANFFNVLGTRALLGRTFSPDDDKPGAQPVLVFSHAYWLRSWGGDPAVVGKILEMNDHPHRGIGVLPPVPQYPNDNDLWMPTSACPFRSDPQAIASRRARGFAVFGRLRPRATVSRARQGP